MRFENVRCLVTGAADGIGRATAERFRAEGAAVLAVDREPRVHDVLWRSKRTNAVFPPLRRLPQLIRDD